MNVSDWLNKEELARFTRRSNLRAGWEVLRTWLLIAAIFWAVSTWTNPITLVLAVIFLGGRQLGLAVLMHEAGHRTLFKNPNLNAWLGQWLCAYPVLGDIVAYSTSHREHHRLAGTRQDPDLPNYRRYPISRASFRRKLWRDISGQTGAKLVAGVFLGTGGNIMMRKGERSRALYPGLLVNALLLLALSFAGIPEFYLLWVIAYLTVYPLVSRIRQVAEHGSVPGLYDPDPRMHTRTTLANPLEQLLICPNSVNYHLEHHFLPGVPNYRLKALHRHLVSKGFYQEHPGAIVESYWGVIKLAVPELGGQPAAPA